MPSPVSPDAGVPEHQPHQYRQTRRPSTGGQPGQNPNGPPPSGQGPRNGQFPSGARPPAGPFASSRPQSGQFTRSGADQAPDRSDAPERHTENGGKSGGPRDWIWSAIAFLVAAAVIGAVAFYFFGPKGNEEAAAEWAVDSCAAPSAESSDGAATDYKPLLCDDPESTVMVLEIQDAVAVSQAHCPKGTDIIFQKDGEAGGTTRVVCARNLSDDHPGDPGMGGGQLVVGDCVDESGTELACASDGARKVAGLIIGANDCPDGTADTINLGFDAQRSYQTICLGKA